MRRVLHALGIDYEQWRALTGVMLKVDLRGGTLAGPGQATDSKSQRSALISQGVFYGVMGLFLLSLALVPDVFLGATIMLTVVMALVGAMVLVEYQSVVVSPDDYAMLGFQPLTSRTYFAVKLTNVFVYVGVIATLLGAPTIITHLVRGGIARGVAAFAAVYGATAFITLGMVVAYALVVRFVHPKRLRRALSYVQMLLALVVYGGYALFPRLIDREALGALEMTDKSWILLYPPSWFASFLDLAGGQRGISELVPAAAGVASVIALLLYSTERLSLSYAERLSALVSASESPGAATSGASRGRSRARRRWLAGDRAARLAPDGETRAMALLMRAQFRYDMKFRMGVLGIVPITLLYVFLSLREGTLPDPFVDAAAGGMQGLGLLHLAAFFLPAMLLLNVASSDSFRAAWVFYATPADKSRLIVAAKNIIVGFVGVPYVLFLAAIFAWFFDSWTHAAIHAVMVGLLANLFVQVVVGLRPRLPFARPVEKGQSSGGLMMVMFITIGVVVGLLPLLLSWLYADSDRTIVAGTLLLFGNVVASNLARRRARERTGRLQFHA